MSGKSVRVTYTIPCDDKRVAQLLRGYIEGLEYKHNTEHPDVIRLYGEFDLSDFDEE